MTRVLTESEEVLVAEVLESLMMRDSGGMSSMAEWVHNGISDSRVIAKAAEYGITIDGLEG